MREEQSRFGACLEDPVSKMVFRDSAASRGYFIGWDSGGCLEYLLSPCRPSPTLSGLTSALGTDPARTTIGVTSGS